MAERRMFAKTIIDSDAFLDMPLSTQCLYFHLSMRADDDGFINNCKKIQRMLGCSDDDLKLLLAKSFLIPFESGVVVIKHWKIHNYIRSDRYKETVYQEEKSQLETKENGAYTFGIPSVNQAVYHLDTQVRLGKDSIGKDNICETSVEVVTEKPKKTKHKNGSYENVLLTDDELNSLKESYPDDYTGIINHFSELKEMKGYKYKSDYLAIKKWGITSYLERKKKEPAVVQNMQEITRTYNPNPCPKCKSPKLYFDKEQFKCENCKGVFDREKTFEYFRKLHGVN